MTLRVLVVDDESVARATVRGLLALDADVELVGECANGAEALDALRALRPNLVFLDVEMPGLDGLAFLEALPEDERPAVVFTTAYDRYAARAFDERAADYLLKPFSDDRFRQALERAKQVLRTEALIRSGRDVAELVEGLTREGAESAESIGGPGRPDRLTIHKEGRVEVVDLAELEWVQAADQYVRLHVRGGGEHLMRASMAELERTLDPRRFTRVHRSAIVSLDRVTRLETRGGGAGRVLLADGTWVPVSRSRVPALRRLLG